MGGELRHRPSLSGAAVKKHRRARRPTGFGRILQASRLSPGAGRDGRSCTMSRAVTCFPSKAPIAADALGRLVVARAGGVAVSGQRRPARKRAARPCRRLGGPPAPAPDTQKQAGTGSGRAKLRRFGRGVPPNGSQTLTYFCGATRAYAGMATEGQAADELRNLVVARTRVV